MDKDHMADDNEVKVEVNSVVKMEDSEEESDQGSESDEDDATTTAKGKYKMSDAKRAWSRESARRMREKLGKEESNWRKNEQRKRRLQTMTPEELEEFRGKTRRWAQLRAKKMTEEQRERKKALGYERRIKKRFEQGLPPPRNVEPPRKGPLTEEEKQRRKQKYAFHELTKRLQLTEEDKEVRRSKERFSRYARLARMSEEERKTESRRLVQKEKIRKANMTPEQKDRYREQMTKAHRKMRQKWKEQYPEKYERHRQYLLERSKKQMETETPEQKQKRLLGYRIYQKKTRLRKQLEKEGIGQEEIERKVQELVEEMKSQPLPPLPEKPRKYERKSKTNKKATSVSTIPNRVAPSTPQTQYSPSDNFLNQNQFVEGSLQFPGPSEDPSLPTLNSYSSSQIGNHSSLSSVSSHEDPDPLGDDDSDNFDDIPASPPSSPAIAIPQLEMQMEFKILLPQPPAPTEATLSASIPVPPKRGRGRPPKKHLAPLTVALASKSGLPIAVPSKTKRSRISKPIVESLAPIPATMPPSSYHHHPSPELDVRITSTRTLLPSQALSNTTVPSELPTVPSAPSITSSPSKTVEVESSSTTTEEIIFPEMCDDCGKTFISKLSLRIHKSEVHNEDPENLTCPKCSAQCETRQGLWEHFVNVHNMDSSNNEDSQAKVNQQSGRQRPYYVKPRPKPPGQSSAATRASPKERHDEQPNQCPECGKTFRQKATLDDHIRRTHEGKGHYCDICGSDCQSLTKLWRHKVERHHMSDLPPPEGIQVISCKYCDELVMRGYEAHVRKKHPEHLEEFLNSDDRNTKLKTVRVKHKTGRISRSKQSTGKGKSTPVSVVVSEIKCPKCDETIAENALKKHWRAKHSLPCPDCGKLCDDVPALEEHYKKTHAFKDIDKKLEAKNLIKFVHPVTKAAVCLICDANLPWSDEIHAHFVSKHLNILEEFLQVNWSPSVSCELCEGLQFLTDVELNAHMETAHPDENYLCPHCGLFRRTQAVLDKHVKSHGLSYKLNRKKFGCCFICKQEFLEVNGVKDISCVTREMSDKVKAHLENHVEKTHPESFFRCPHCPKWSYNLAGIRGHSSWCFKQTLKNKCEVDLPKKEKRLGNKKYMASTLGQMKILCKLCKLGFSMRSMKAHLATVHRIIQDSFQCEHCPRKFSLYEYLVGHMELVHEIPLEEIVLIPGPEDKMSNEVSRKGLRKWKRRAKKNSNCDREEKAKRDIEEGEDDEVEPEISDSSDDANDDDESDASESKTNKKKKRLTTTNKQPQRRSIRASRGKSSKYKTDPDSEDPAEEAIPSSIIEPKSRRKKVTQTLKSQAAKESTKQLKVKAEVKYPDLEKDKRLVIYVYPLTEEDLKPYIKKASLDLDNNTSHRWESADESNMSHFTRNPL